MISNIKFFFIKFLFGTNQKQKNKKVKSALFVHIQTCKNVWSNEKYDDFGLERIIRLSLIVLQFFSIGLYIRHFAGKLGLIQRKIGLELYVLLKLFFPLIALTLNSKTVYFFIFISIYFILETLLYILSLIFLSPEFKSAISFRRSLLLIYINFLEITLNFSLIYCILDYYYKVFGKETLSALDYVYFSFVTSATVGYGDYFPSDSISKIFVIFQIMISFIFVTLIINVFLSKLQEKTFYNSK